MAEKTNKELLTDLTAKVEELTALIDAAFQDIDELKNKQAELEKKAIDSKTTNPNTNSYTEYQEVMVKVLANAITTPRGVKLKGDIVYLESEKAKVAIDNGIVELA